MDFITSVVVLYIIVDPIGNIPLFMVVTSRFDKWKKNRILATSVMTASLVLILFALAGVELFGYFGVNLSDFMIASGVILVIFSLSYLLKPYEHTVSAEGVEIAVVPLAVPFLAGPASISYTIVLTRSGGPLFAIAVVIVTAILTYVTLRASDLITRLLGLLGIRVVEKIMLIISAAIGISLVRKGLMEWNFNIHNLNNT